MSTPLIQNAKTHLYSVKFKSQLTMKTGKEAPKVSNCVIQDSCWQRLMG